MCSDTELFEMLVTLHIFLFLMSYDNDKMSLCNIRLSQRTTGPKRYIVTYHWASFSIVKDSLIANEIFRKLFDT